MLTSKNETFHYHAIVDKDDNVMAKYPTKNYAIRFAKSHPQAVAIKEVYHTITEELVWRKEDS